MVDTPAPGPARITAKKVTPLGERTVEQRQPGSVAHAMIAAESRREPDPALAREVEEATLHDARVQSVSADVDPPLLIPEAMPNPDEEIIGSRGQQQTDEERREASQQAAVAEHLRDIDADVNHPLRGAAGRNRLSFGTRSARLTAPSRAGFHRHWFNEVAGRIDRALRAGYKIVNDTDGKPMKRVVGTLSNGNGLTAFYMEIPVAWYVEDMKAARKPVDDLERTIKQGKLGATEHMYVPKSGIEFEEEASGDFRPRA